MYSVNDFHKMREDDPGYISIGKKDDLSWQNIRSSIIRLACEDSVRLSENGSDTNRFIMLSGANITDAAEMCHEAFKEVEMAIQKVAETGEKQSILIGFARSHVDKTEYVLRQYDERGHKAGIDTYKAIWKMDLRANDSGNIAMFFYEVSKHLNNWILVRFANGDFDMRFFSDEYAAWSALTKDFCQHAEELMKETSFEETLETAKSILSHRNQYNGDLFSFARDEESQSHLVMFDPMDAVFWEIRKAD